MYPWRRQGHKWLGARVAWRFGATLYGGQCVAWRIDGRRSLWRVVYDDGDVEDFEFRHMCQGLRFHREVQKKQASRTHSPIKVSIEQIKPTRRAVGVVGTGTADAPRCQRRAMDPMQDVVTFPILISPSYLTADPGISAAIGPWWEQNERESCETPAKRPLLESNCDRPDTPSLRKKKRFRTARRSSGI